MRDELKAWTGQCDHTCQSGGGANTWPRQPQDTQVHYAGTRIPNLMQAAGSCARTDFYLADATVAYDAWNVAAVS